MILVVDDAEDIRGLFGVWLKKDYEVKFAVTGTEALALADTEPCPTLTCWTSSCRTWTATRSASA